MKKNEVYVEKRKINVICWVVSIIFLLAIIFTFVLMIDYLELIAHTNSQLGQFGVQQKVNADAKILIFNYIFPFIAYFVGWFMTIYVLSTVSGNRKLIKDIVVVLNETDIIHKGVEKLVENEYFSFESDEFEC